MKKFLTTIALSFLAAFAYATTPKISGYVRIGDSLPSVYAPCAMVPNTPFSNPGTAPGKFYYRYDASVLPVAGPNTYGKYLGQGGATHTDQYGGYNGMTYPIKSGLHPPIPFPAPPVSANLCAVYQGTGCPTSDDVTYARKLAGHPDWTSGAGAFKTVGHYKEDCQGVVPTAVPTGRPTPGKPTPTKSPVPLTYCCDANGFIQGTSAPCPGGTPKCATSPATTTPAPSMPVPARTVPPKSTASPVPPVKATATPTKKPLPPVTLPPSASSSPKVAAIPSSPTPTNSSGGSGSNTGLLVLIAGALGGLLIGIAHILAIFETGVKATWAKVKAFFARFL